MLYMDEARKTPEPMNAKYVIRSPGLKTSAASMIEAAAIILSAKFFLYMETGMDMPPIRRGINEYTQSPLIFMIAEIIE